MATDMTEDVFAGTAFGQIALKKMGDVSENFRLFKAGWLGSGDPKDSEAMEVTGAEFREAKSGPNKGVLHIMVPGTSRTVQVGRAEMKAHTAKLSGGASRPI